MQWTWFDLNWAWIGLALSTALLLLLFTTNIFRSELSLSRWRDPIWLSWLAPAAYMIHQFEEYAIDVPGTRFAFPDYLCTSLLGLPPYPACSVPPAFFIAVNIPAIWITGLVCGILSRRHPFVGLGVYAIHFTNGLWHVGASLVSGTYNPGVLVAAVICLPLSVWVAYVCFIRGGMRRRGMAVMVLAGVLLHVVLIVSAISLAKGHLSAPLLVAIQVLNPLWVILVPWLFEKSVLGQTRGAKA